MRRRRDMVYRLGAAQPTNETAGAGDYAAVLGGELAGALGLTDGSAVVVDDDGTFDSEATIKSALNGLLGKWKAAKHLGNRKDSTQKTFYIIYESLMWTVDQLALCNGPLAPAVRDVWYGRVISLIRGLMTVANSGALAIFSDSGQSYFAGLIERALGNAIAVLQRMMDLERTGGPACSPTSKVSITGQMKSAWDVRDNAPAGSLIQWVITNKWDPADGPPRDDAGSRRDWRKYFVQGVPPRVKFDLAALKAQAATAAGASGGSYQPGAYTPPKPTPGADEEEGGLVVSGKAGGKASNLGQLVGLGVLLFIGGLMLTSKR